MASEALTKHEAVERAEGRGRALANLRRKIKTSASRMTDAGVTVAGGFAAGVMRAKMPDADLHGFHANQIGGGLAVAVGLAGVFDDSTSDLVASFGAGLLAFEIGREAEKRIAKD